MQRHQFRFSGLLAVLLALAVQLGLGASVPDWGEDGGGIPLCHADTADSGTPRHAPDRPPLNCLVCPFCVALHATVILPPGAPVLSVPATWSLASATIVPPARAPPHLGRTPNQPRAPPAIA